MVDNNEALLLTFKWRLKKLGIHFNSSQLIDIREKFNVSVFDF